jgi:CheY-like chemotaxis protein
MIDLLEKATDPNLPDIIILDQNMPKMTGKESLIFLKENQRYRHIPAFVYSTYPVLEFYRECLDLGAQDVLAKPNTMQAYRQMIDRFLFYPADSHPDKVESLRSSNE